MIGAEAYLSLQYLLDGGGVLEDPAVDYLAERVDEMDAAALLEAMALLQERLRRLQPDGAERIRITRDFRILLPERFDTEIRLRPSLKPSSCCSSAIPRASVSRTCAITATN